MPRAFHSVCIWWLRFPDAFSLMISSPLSSSMYALVYPHAPSIHPTIGSASYFPYPATLYFSFFLLRCLPELLMLNNRCAAAAATLPPRRADLQLQPLLTCTAQPGSSQVIPQCPAIHPRSIDIVKGNG